MRKPWPGEQLTYSVPGMTCGHCVAAVRQEVERVAGVESVDVALDTKRVTLTGTGIDAAAVRAAIERAGYEVSA
jgi:copper chaperone